MKLSFAVPFLAASLATADDFVCKMRFVHSVGFCEDVDADCAASHNFKYPPIAPATNGESCEGQDTFYNDGEVWCAYSEYSAQYVWDYSPGGGEVFNRTTLISATEADETPSGTKGTWQFAPADPNVALSCTGSFPPNGCCWYLECNGTLYVDATSCYRSPNPLTTDPRNSELVLSVVLKGSTSTSGAFHWKAWYAVGSILSTMLILVNSF